MKATFMTGPESCEIRDIPTPKPGEKEVLIRVRACGICGSDIGLYKMGMEDRILGHEFSGDIAAVGAGVSGWKEGDRVVVEPLLPCWECYWCKHGKHNLCPYLGYTGIMDDGGFAEYVKVPVYQLHRLPDEVSYLQGALVEPLSVSLHGVLNSIMRPGDTVMVSGCGIIGLFALLWARTLGAGLMIASEVSEARIAAAEKLADVVLNPTQVDLAQEIGSLTNEVGPRVLFECSGVPTVQAEAINLVARGGQVVLLGVSYDLVPVSLMDITTRGISVIGSIAYSSLDGEGEFPMTLEFLRTKRINPEIVPLTTMPLEQIGEGFKAAKAGKYAKVVIIPD